MKWVEEGRLEEGRALSFYAPGGASHSGQSWPFTMPTCRKQTEAVGHAAADLLQRVSAARIEPVC